jgi:hypothetical protein
MSTQKEFNLKPEDVRINEEGAVEIVNKDLTQQLIAYHRAARFLDINVNCGKGGCNNYCKPAKAVI